MKTEKYLKIATPLTLAGVLFAGYLSGVKLFSGTCAFNESCPTFLGYPACYYGFVMFSAMFVATLVALVRKVSGRWPLKFNLVVSVLGIIFAGSFTVQEVARWAGLGFKATFLGLSTCAYGLIFYIGIFVFTLISLLKKEAAPAVPPAQPPQQA